MTDKTDHRIPELGIIIPAYNEQDGIAVSFNYLGENDFSAYFRAEYADESYTPRAVVGKSSLSHISAPDDFLLLGSLNDGAVNMPIPGGIRGYPEATPEECAGARSFSYLVGFAPACASMLVGDQGDAKESDIDQSPNPETGRDFNGTEIENLRTELNRHTKTMDEEIARLKDLLDQQRIRYDQVKHRAAEYFSKTQVCRQETGLSEPIADGFHRESTENDIEIELLRRKEALGK